MKAGCPKFREEGISFLCTRDSSEPISIGLGDIRRKRPSEDQFGCVSAAARSEYARQFTEDQVTRWIQIEDTVHESNVN